MEGQRFGMLTVVESAGKNKHRMALWKCKCDCGGVIILQRGSLISGNTKTCGCKTNDLKSTHGHKRNVPGAKYRGSKTYVCWAAMKSRCSNPRHKNWKDYGGRGIKVCEEWMQFENFLNDMGERPDGMTIERLDNNLGYCKSNCRWVRNETQQMNRRNNLRITIKGETKIASEWARVAGINKETFLRRVHAGWPSEQLLQPVKN